MADYDVGVVGLSTPPTAAVVTPYRPAVSVRNNGLYDAVASGYVRIYAAGLLIFESEVYSNTLAPGETGDAEALQNWTPTAEGTYIIQGYVTSPLDQVEPNNNLAPVTIIVGPGTPPTPPTPVTIHATQHEEGGDDELSIEGLRGRAGDLQNPVTHASAHEVGGTDPVNVQGMPGVLAEAQNPKLHANTHKVAGIDPLDVATLPGADELEYLANKDQPNGYSGLDSSGRVFTAALGDAPIPGVESHGLRFDRTWGPVMADGQTVPLGLCCAWDNGEPIPDGWTTVLISPGLTLPFVWIKYVGV
jgi:hypothetical protein